MSMFQKATKRAVRARIAFDGPSGSGKTWTGLEWATRLGKKVAFVDTERGSASLYADRFDFDVLEISPPFHPDRLVAAIHDAEKAGYDVMVIDSLSHFWEGEGGTLELVDAAAARANGNSWAGWKSGTPILRHLIDTILASDMHVIATMRSKTEWVLEEKINSAGRKSTTPMRVGMAPVMRGGVEYEFTMVGDLDLEHRMTISKSRCDALADQVIQPGRAGEAADIFIAWTQSGEEMAGRNDIDALKGRMNKIEPSETRVECKRGFADQFGNPDYLVASKLPAADAYVSGWEGTTDQGRPFEEAPAEQSAQVQPEDQQPEPEQPKPARAYTAGNKLHIAASGLNVGDEDLDFLLLNVTGGRTSSANDLTASEDGAVRELLAWVTDPLKGAGRMAEIRAKVAEAAGQQTMAAS